MKRISILALLTFTSLVGVAQDTTFQTIVPSPKVQVSFVYPIGSSGFNSINETYHASINIFAGATGGIDGLEMAGFANLTHGSVEGVQLSGFLNVVTDSVTGVQLTGFSNLIQGEGEGLQAAGFTNVILKSHHGAQLSGFANYINDSLRGAQLSGFVNVTVRDVTGIQGAGFVNYAAGVKGSQIAGFTNINTGNLKGNQLAGFLNLSTAEVEGVQVAGFVNVARKIKGAQLGFINFADTIEGVAVGFFSYARNGYHQFELSSNETFQTTLSFKTGTNPFYNVFSAGVHWDKDNPVWAVGYGIGTRKEFKNQFVFNAELNSFSVLPDNFDDNEWESLNKLTLSFAKGIGQHLEVFAGASINMWISESETPKYDYLGSTKYKGENGTVHWILYPGFQFGVRI